MLFFEMVHFLNVLLQQMQEYEQEDGGISLPCSSDGSFDRRSSNRLVLSFMTLQGGVGKQIPLTGKLS